MGTTKNKFRIMIKELRLQYGLSQTELAARLSTTQRKISYWESGHIEPDLDALIEIANHFGISVDELIGRTEY
jgi:transcriptional regulator with XRE-family HTH domain